MIIPQSDIIAIIATLPPTLVALLTLWYSRKNTSAIQEVHLSINSRMDELLKAAKGEAIAEGREIGRSEIRT